MQRSSRVLWCVLALGLAAGWTAGLARAAEEAAAKEKAAAKKNVDAAGTWRWEREYQGNIVKSELRLNQKKGVVTGTYKRGDRENKIKKGKVDGNKLTVEFTFQGQDREVSITFQGDVKKDDVQGTVSIVAGDWSRDFEWQAKRSVQWSDVVGIWKFQIEVGDGQVIEPSVELSKDGDKVKGAYTSRFGEREAKQIKLEKNRLSFQIAGENEGRSFSVTYDGLPRGDSIRGTIDYDFDGQTGTIDFQGQRQPKKTE